MGVDGPRPTPGKVVTFLTGLTGNLIDGDRACLMRAKSSNAVRTSHSFAAVVRSGSRPIAGAAWLKMTKGVLVPSCG